MPVKNGVNPDYTSDDELDVDALDALIEYHDGSISFEELKDLVGAAAATTARLKASSEDDDLYDPLRYFDNPEDLV